MAYHPPFTPQHHHHHHHDHLHHPPPPSDRPQTPVSPLLPDFPLPGSANDNASARPHMTTMEDGSKNAPDLSPMSSARSPTMSRSGSMSSYTSAWTNNHFSSNPRNVRPLPAYVAPFGASQVVSERTRRLSDDEDDHTPTPRSGGHDDLHFSAAALSLLNAFLDQLLYSFLSHARSTALTALRPAVVEVLKARLAGEAIASAQEELHELLAGGDEEEEEMNQRQTAAEQSRKWDTELVWKRTRLRVMVYIRLGDMEDDDEERYVREDDLFLGSDRRFSHSTGLVSWAAAIFLTSIVEYVAEQVLQVAAHAAESRARRQSRAARVSLSASGMVTPVDGVTVEDYDMEKVALHSMLGRLWRTWRKSLRNNANPTPPAPTALSNNFSRRLSREVYATAMSPKRSSPGPVGPGSSSALDGSRRQSDVTDDKASPGERDVPEAQEQYAEDVLAANIAIPVSDAKRDVDEIEIPGLARDPDDAETNVDDSQTIAPPKRRNSLTGYAPYKMIEKLIGTFTADQSAIEPNDSEPPAKPPLPRQRSYSLPTLATRRILEEDSAKREEEDDSTAETVPGAFPVEISPGTEDATAETVEEEDAEAENGGAAKAGVGSVEAENAEAEHVQAKDAAAEHVEAEGIEAEGIEAEGVEAEGVEAENAEAGGIEAEGVEAENAEAGGIEAEGVEAENAAAETGERPEQKASATEMAVHKQEVSSVKPAAQEQKPKTNGIEGIDRTKVFGKAAAGTAAAALAAVSVVYGDKFTAKKGAKGDLRSRPAAGTGATDHAKDRVVDKPGNVGQVGDSTTPTDGLHSDALQVEGPPPKALETAAGETSSRDEGRANKTTTREQRSSSSSVDIGVAKTSDTAVSTPGREDLPIEARQTRDTFISPPPSRPRLFLDEDTPSSPTRSDGTPLAGEIKGTSPEGFLKNRSLQASMQTQQVEKLRSQSLHDQARPSKHSPQPSSIVTTNGNVSPLPSPRFEKVPSPWRQSAPAGTDKGTSWAPSSKKSSSISEPSPALPIQEHPVVEKMANKQRNASKDESAVLTSASIKGPEDFEMFVQGGDTVKYTLTPETVRDGLSPVGVVVSNRSRNSESAPPVPRGEERPSPPQESSSEGRTGRSNSIKHATSATPTLSDAEDEERRGKNKEKRRSISRPPVRNTSIHRKSGLMAREPQVQTDSTRDFADFIRSTGPTKEQEVQPVLSNRRSSASLHSLRQAASRSSSPGGASARSLHRAAVAKDPVPPLPPVPAKSKTSLQPREPIIHADPGTSELIDFIRTGPRDPQTGEARQHRISRTVAPFRTTMDSDQMDEWGERLAAQPDIKLNTDVTSAPSLRSGSSLKTSTRTSANSRSALLNGNNSASDTVHPAHSGQPQRLVSSALKPTASAPAEGFPTVKRYRNKDPYAIDVDSEDDDLLTALPKQKREEESLIDFLKNTSPPKDTSRPHHPNTTAAAGAAKNNTKTTPSNATPRRGSAPAIATLKTHGADILSVATPNARRGSAPNKDGPQPARIVPAVPRQTTTSVAVGPITKPRPQLQARSAKEPATADTSDLADFFKTSGPPTTAAAAAANAPHPRPPAVFARQNSSQSKASVGSGSGSHRSGGKRGGLFWGLFSKKAVPVGGKQYLDM